MIPLHEKETFLNFIERNVAKAPMDLDEGIGTVYERGVIDDYFQEIHDRYGIQTVLETPADGVTGMPGVNSIFFAYKGFEVCLTNPSQTMLDKAREVWEQKGIIDLGRFVKCEVDELPFEDNQFDMVWNYCIFERFRNPDPLISEMKRVSRKYVMIMTQNCFNFGTPFHIAYHRLRRSEFDHGYLNLMRMKNIRTVLTRNGLKEIERGALDIPPWMDTWDMPIRGDLKRILSMVGKNWEWKQQDSSETQCNENNDQPKILPFLTRIEGTLPVWFKIFQAHHLYILAET
ncbi:MAG: class I SAM-dependent methyltransferase [Chloroflexota bacterium]|nr:class I SAM-dependent methyltransferase [Chloroflexota bacterium]